MLASSGDTTPVDLNLLGFCGYWICQCACLNGMSSSALDVSSPVELDLHLHLGGLEAAISSKTLGPMAFIQSYPDSLTVCPHTIDAVKKEETASQD